MTRANELIESVMAGNDPVNVISEKQVDKKGSGAWTVYFEKGNTIHRWSFSSKKSAADVAQKQSKEPVAGYITVMKNGIDELVFYKGELTS